ncbi:MAG: dihydrofolate reductase family protein [Deltaproteobacteria bacterium]|nr:dihydrofolate reductase family protein [Nannocystaceae bacterium]
MQTTLWATLTANGNYQRNDPEFPPRPEALADFAAHVRDHGNFIVGRTTFEQFARQPAGRAPDGEGLGTPTIVVVTRATIPGVLTATSPAHALELLRERGFMRALVSGGARLHNSFLAADLIDQLVVDVAPVLEDPGFALVLPEGRRRTVTLVGTSSLGGGVVQLRYDLGRT